MLAALSEVSQDTDIPVIKRLLRAGDLNKQVEEVLLIVVLFLSNQSLAILDNHLA